MSAYRFHLFDTALGRCGLLWSDAGIRRSQLPETDDDALRRRLTRGLDARDLDTGDLKLEEAVPDGPAAAAIAGIQALMAGAPDDLDAVVLDESALGSFDAQVYALCRAVRRGETTTYGAIAKRLGDPTLSRAVGQSLGRNPFAPIVPCHRVTGADGWLGGFSAEGGVDTKVRLLRIEGAAAAPGPSLFEHFGVEE